jgi:putative phosphoribosyl transferase
MRFRDRTKAGQLLAEKLSPYADRKDVAVLALPRGGVPVGYEIANTLNTPFDILVVRKLGLPTNPELAMGAIAANGVRVLNDELIRWLNIPEATIDAVAAQESVELRRREQAYRGEASHLEAAGKSVILVDDGIATAFTMRAAVAVLRLCRPAQIVIAVPIAPASSVDELRTEVDDVVSCLTSEEFESVDEWYEDFRQISDESVRDLYERAKRRSSQIKALKSNPGNAA